CGADEQCDDGFPCNGEESCDLSTHRCRAGLMQDGVVCTLDDEMEGRCAGGACVPAGCGNGVVDSAEECDDGRNGRDDDGCRDDCTYTCDEETPCADADMCNGEKTCNLE